jgi:hypothetical protein
MTYSLSRFHNEWPRLLDPTGSFLTLPVLKRAFADGLEPAQKEQVAELRTELDLLRGDPQRRPRFIRWVLSDLLSYGPVLREGQAIPLHTSHTVPEHGVTLRPDYVVVDPEVVKPTARVLVTTWSAGTDLTGRVAGEHWNASPVDRMALLLRATKVGLGIVTDGTRWMLVSTVTPATSTALWDVDIWFEERVTLDAFLTLLGARRLFAVAGPNRLEALLTESIGAEAEIAGQLGLQVRQAVELLVNAFSRADRETNGRLLYDVTDADVYSAAVTLMMRLVFLLYSEERHLFPVDDDLYASSYAVSTLLAELDDEAQREGDDPLDRRSAAWGRLLAVSRAIFTGVQHEDLRLPAYGGSLFDPERYPFLEGRPTATTPLADALPIKVTDLDVLDILKALQILQFRVGGVVEARRLSYRNLDVESIGHVYEGLLDHGAMRVEDVHLGLKGKNSPEVPLAELERRHQAGEASFQTWLVETGGMTAKQVAKALDAAPTDLALKQLRAACHGDDATAARITPLLGLVRSGARDLPSVFLPGSIYVTQSTGRRSSGTYYTPRSLAEEMVQYALEPLVYAPGPQDGNDRSQWKLRSAAEILDLKVCDMTMGSGAFLVAACRFLADRLLETTAAGGDGRHAPGDSDDAVVEARRFVVEHCIYGVERNPMAVEMAKLSMWLVTVAKDRPFTFLDAQLRPGDALLGLTSVDQLENLHLDPEQGRKIHAGHLFVSDIAGLSPLLAEARSLRDRLSAIHVTEVRDAEDKRRLYEEYSRLISDASVVADTVVAAAVSTAQRGAAAFDTRLMAASKQIKEALALDGRGRRSEAFAALRRQADAWLDEGRPDDAPRRNPLQWCLEFPEVFDRARPGFDAVVGNPPFQGGSKLTGTLGLDYRAYVVKWIANGGRGNADLIAYMFLRAAGVGRGVALLATNTVAQGDTREVGLDAMSRDGWCIVRANKSRKWPGEANLEIAQLWLQRYWNGAATLIDGDVEHTVAHISSALDDDGGASPPIRLRHNRHLSFKGSNVYGMGFVLDPAEARALIAKDQRNRQVLFPFLNGEDLNTSPDCSAQRWVINFFDWPVERAQTYGDCWRIIEERVRPERQRRKPSGEYVLRAPAPQRFWQYEMPRPGLYATIASQDLVLALTLHSSALQAALVPSGQVFSHGLAIFAFDDYAHLALLCSSLHTWWAQLRGSTLRTDVRYATTDCFETFPMPRLDQATNEAGRVLHDRRRAIMLGRNLGLTKIYNLVHNPEVGDADVASLRDAHVLVDEAIRSSYGWSDVELDHGFHETPLGRRFAVSPAARRDLLRRLLDLNHARAAEEAILSAASPSEQRGARRARRATTSATMGVDTELPLALESELPL